MREGLLISENHVLQYRRYYAERAARRAKRPNVWLPQIEKLATEVGATSVLDFGCGEARGISKFWRRDGIVVDYDPGVYGCHDTLQVCDLVVSIHMLEHVEPQFVNAVFNTIVGHARDAVLIVVSCEASTKLLPDGTPWHTFVKPADWWRQYLSDRHFTIVPSIKDPEKEVAAVLHRK